MAPRACQDRMTCLPAGAGGDAGDARDGRKSSTSWSYEQKPGTRPLPRPESAIQLVGGIAARLLPKIVGRACVALLIITPNVL